MSVLDAMLEGRLEGEEFVEAGRHLLEEQERIKRSLEEGDFEFRSDDEE